MLIARISRDETHIDAIGGPSEIMTESVIVLSSIYQSFKAYDPQLAEHYRKTLRAMVQKTTTLCGIRPALLWRASQWRFREGGTTDMLSTKAPAVSRERVTEELAEQYGPEELWQVEQLSRNIFRAWLRSGRVAVAWIQPDGSLEIRALEEA